MTYKNIKELISEVEKFHPVLYWESLDNYLSIKEKITEAINQNDVHTAFKEMCRLTGIYDDLTRVSRYCYTNINDITKDMTKSKTIEQIKKDFLVASTEIEYEYCNNGLTGDFEINKKAIETNWKLIDWDAYYNQNLKTFTDACKKADKMYNINTKDIIECYIDDSRYNFIEVYPTLYNERVIGIFDNEDDAYYWAENYNEIEKIDELYYVNHYGY